MELTRREILSGGSLLVVSGLAGCLEDVPGSPGGDDEHGDDGTEGNGGDEADPEVAGSEHNSTESESDGYSLVNDETLVYAIPAGDKDGVDVEPLFSADDTEAIDTSDLPEDRRTEVETFLKETDFGTSKIVSVRVWAPNQCHDLEVTNVTTDEDGLTARASVRDESEDVCTSGPTTNLTGLIRTAFDGEVPTSGTVTVTRSDGTEHASGYGVDRDVDEGGHTDTE
ncbi:hypothetical protein ACYJ1Y_08270 [Natrialbaceae archaeon A-gly3]